MSEIVAYLLGIIIFGIVLRLDIDAKWKEPKISLHYDVDPESSDTIMCTQAVWDQLPSKIKNKFSHVIITDNTQRNG